MRLPILRVEGGETRLHSEGRGRRNSREEK